MTIEDWHLVRLADLCESIDYGYTASASAEPIGPRFLRITDIVQGFTDWSSVPFCSIEDRRMNKFRLAAGDIVIARTGASTGASAYIQDPPDAVFASYLVRLRINRELAYPRFVAYYLRSPHYWDYVHGVLGDKSAQPNASARTLTQARLSVPPLRVQRATADLLGTIDDKIELNRRMNETLEELARAIFRSWFVDFNPVRAKMEGHQPFGMDVTTAALFPESLADSELGPIPEGWEIMPIGDAVVVVGGSTPSTKEPAYWDGPHFFATPKELAGLESRVLLKTERTISDSGLQRISSGLLPLGTVLLSSRAPIGYVAISEVPVAVNQGFIAMVCNKDLPRFYVMQWAASNVEIFKQNAGGTTFAEINKRSFRPIPVLVPPKPLLDAYEATSKPLYERITASQQESDTLVRLRDALLPKLVSGEVRIREAEQMAEAAL